MQEFNVYDNVEFYNRGTKEVGSVESINIIERTAVVLLEFHQSVGEDRKVFSFDELTLIPPIYCSGQKIKDFFHFDCSREQLTNNEWYTFYPEFNVLLTDDDVYITIEDVVQGLRKVEELELWDSESFDDWKYVLAYQVPDLLLDYNDASKSKISDGAMQFVDAIRDNEIPEGENGLDYRSEIAISIMHNEEEQK